MSSRKARQLFERPKTPWFVVAMLGIFAGMGAARHAARPWQDAGSGLSGRNQARKTG
ncbi:MAG: hypothetical protein R2845_06035 [Thermomicrobiales bacterium]